MFIYTPALNKKFKKILIKRFELTYFRRFFKKNLIDDLQLITNKNIKVRNPLNIIYSQVHNVNKNLNDLKQLNILKQYLIKTYKGRCHALGKPVRGQRSWSNS